ncbi:MAG: DUF3795 domain-containing protein [Dehalococcoidales bacterium]|nr:DUF3795 domain-containing protein [Dehalococcoidales bacterium]
MAKAELMIIGYCGLNCADCFSYKQTVSEAAKALRRELRTAGLKQLWTDVPFLGEYESFKKSLDGLAKFRCTKVCRDGGGNPWCKIRLCARKKEYTGCWDCADFESCNKLVERYKKELRKIKKTRIKQLHGN